MDHKKLISYFKQVDDWLLSHIPLLLLLLLLILLRIPNFFEPYWYGDEGIYLTIGNALRNGERLYAETIDHKTPLIYYLASVPNQMSFRLLLLFWMMAATTAFHHLAKIFVKPKSLAIITTAIFIILTTIPWFEGHIANGELFVMGFIMVGTYFLTKTNLFVAFTQHQKLKKISNDNILKLIIAGGLFGLGILTKVPGVLDVAAFFSLAWFLILDQSFKTKLSLKKFLATVWQLLPHFVWLAIGVGSTIALSAVYFIAKGSGQAYLDFGLLYNFRYAGSWGLPFDNALLVWLFSLPGKIFLIGLVVLIISLLQKKISPGVKLFTTWGILALVGATLSNRPYPHYFLQVLPPLLLLSGIALSQVYQWLRYFGQPRKKNPFPFFSTGASLLLASMFISVLLLLDVGLYQTQKYYQQFYQLSVGKISIQEYRNSFNHLMDDNYKAAEIIGETGVSEMFIWGTNPMLYALTKTHPTGRFTVSFHIKDFNAYDETLADLKQAEPLFIVVMKDEDGAFPGFYEYLDENYIPNQNFIHYTLWKRQPDPENSL